MGIQDNIRKARDAVADISLAFARSAGRDFGEDVKDQAFGSSEIAPIQTRIIQQERERAAAARERPSLENVEFALRKFGTDTEEGRALTAAKKWNPNSYSNFYKQDLSGFALSDPTIRRTKDFMNQDGDGAITSFYSNINFLEANINDTYIEPATSFNEEVAKAAQLNNITFNGMKEGDPAFKFGRGTYNDAKITGIEGGEIIFGTGSVVDGIEFQGKSAKVKVESGARIEHIKADKHFSIIKFDAEPGSMIANSDLTSVTVSMASKLEGCEFNNIQFGQSLEGLEFKKGCKLKNVSVNGKPIENPQELRKYGAEVDDSVTAEVSADFRKQCAMDMIRKSERSILEAGAALGKAEKTVADIKAGNAPPIEVFNTAMPEPSQAAPQTVAQAPAPEIPPLEIFNVAPPIENAKAGIEGILASISDKLSNSGVSGGQKADLTQVALNQEVFQQERTQPDISFSRGPGE